MCPEIDSVFATLKKTTTLSTDCICYHQLKPCYVNSSRKSTKISTTTATTRSSSTISSATSLHFSINFRPNFCYIFILYTTLLLSFQQCLLLGGVCAAPQSCIHCDINDLKANAKSSHSSSYEEFLFEHQVTRQDAIMALRLLNDSFYDGPSPELSCKSVTCSKTVMKYCLSPQFINDHCWCEQGHSDEGLPFIPHICYVGEQSYSPSVGTCFFYEEVKECCCSPALAKQWRHISRASVDKAPLLMLILLLILQAGLRRSSL